MRNGSLLFSAVQVLMIAALFSGGAAFFGLHYLPQARYELSEWIVQQNASFLFLGLMILGVALLLSICFWMMQRGHYIRIEMREPRCFLDQDLVRKTIGIFWKEEFPEKQAPMEIYFARQKIEVITEGVEYDLEEIEQRLGKLLREQLGYEREFFVTFTLK